VVDYEVYEEFDSVIRSWLTVVRHWNGISSSLVMTL
jgi:hypothetical protein